MRRKEPRVHFYWSGTTPTGRTVDLHFTHAGTTVEELRYLHPRLVNPRPVPGPYAQPPKPNVDDDDDL